MLRIFGITVIMIFLFVSKSYAVCVYELRHPPSGTMKGGCMANPNGDPGVHCLQDPDGWYKYVCYCDSNRNCYEEEWGDNTWPNTHDCSCSGGSSCFLPGTKIKTPNGEKNIEEIKKGDKVVSYIPQTPKETIQNTVKEPYSVTRDHFYEIETLSGKIIRATDEHPFYIGFEKQKKTSMEKIKSLFNISYIYFSDGWQEIKEKINL